MTTTRAPKLAESKTVVKVPKAVALSELRPIHVAVNDSFSHPQSAPQVVKILLSSNSTIPELASIAFPPTAEGLVGLCRALANKKTMPVDPLSGPGTLRQQLALAEYHSGEGIIPLLPSIMTPLLLVTGDMDEIVPPQTQARSCPKPGAVPKGLGAVDMRSSAATFPILSKILYVWVMHPYLIRASCIAIQDLLGIKCQWLWCLRPTRPDLPQDRRKGTCKSLHQRHFEWYE